MDWKINNEKLEKSFNVKSFSEAAKITVDIAIISDKMDHHPDVFITGYNKIIFYIYTHTENKITNKDEELAKEIDHYFDRYNLSNDVH